MVKHVSLLFYFELVCSLHSRKDDNSQKFPGLVGMLDCMGLIIHVLCMFPPDCEG